jgi:hypothetical protein
MHLQEAEDTYGHAMDHWIGAAKALGPIAGLQASHPPHLSKFNAKIQGEVLHSSATLPLSSYDFDIAFPRSSSVTTGCC